jgi:hypothetical protein
MENEGDGDGKEVRKIHRVRDATKRHELFAGKVGFVFEMW